MVGAACVCPARGLLLRTCADAADVGRLGGAKRAAKAASVCSRDHSGSSTVLRQVPEAREQGGCADNAGLHLATGYVLISL